MLKDENKISAEEKLLKVIEDPLGATIPPLPFMQQTKKNKTGFSFKGLFQRYFAKGKKIKINLHFVNNTILVICFIVTFVWLFIFVQEYQRWEKRFAQWLKAGQSSAPDKKQRDTFLLEKVSLTELQDSLKKRNPFVGLGIDEKGQKTLNISSANPQADAILNNLKLVGIIWSQQPQAMIETQKDQRTYLVGVNDTMEGNIKVKKIMREKVILDIDGQERELR